MKNHNTKATNYVMQLSEKKNISTKNSNETYSKKLFTPLKTPKRTHFLCNQFNALQDLTKQFDDNFNLHIAKNNMKRKQTKHNKKTLL